MLSLINVRKWALIQEYLDSERESEEEFLALDVGISKIAMFERLIWEADKCLVIDITSMGLKYSSMGSVEIDTFV